MSSVKPSGVVTFLTDFGLGGPYVGVMHGVLLDRFPEARIVDLTHGIAAQDVCEAAYWIAASFRYFPEGTVHTVVVDPGVGSERVELAAEVDGHFFIAPDNGVLGLVLASAKRGKEVRRIQRKKLGLKAISSTFHGRDVFTPAAAELAAGRLWLTEMGPTKDDIVPSPVAAPTVGEDQVEGEIVAIDHFGNLISNIPFSMIPPWPAMSAHVGTAKIAMAGTFSDVPIGGLLAYRGSFGHLEIAQREGNARAALEQGKRARITVSPD